MKELLQGLGFPEYHSKILLFLWEKQDYADAKQIESNAKVPLTRIYSIMLELKKNNLIQVMPGKVNLYKTLPKEKLIESIKSYKESQIKQQKQSIDDACKLLSQKLSSKPGPEQVAVTYFNDNDSYWKEYLKEDFKLKEGDVQRIINNIRLCSGFIKEELEVMSKAQAKSTCGEHLFESKVKVKYIINPKSIIENTIASLKNKEKIQQSLNGMLEELKKDELYSDIFTSDDTSRILIGINPTCIFMEFYGDDPKRILSAIKIEGKDIARDFAKWFDALAKSCKKKTYAEFEKEIMRLVKSI